MDEKPVLFAEERKKVILDLLDNQERVEVADLVERFNVSGSTIRTDMRELEKENKLIRTHGGAIGKPRENREDNPKVRMLTKEKIAIAKYAAGLIQEEDSIVIDTGTSCLAFTEELVKRDLKKVKVLTYDLQIATILSEKTNFEIYFIGGLVRNKFQYVAGESALNEIKEFVVDRAIISTTSFDVKHGYSTPNVGTGQIKQAVLSIAKQKIMLCDSAKFGKKSFKLFAKPENIDILITDKKLSTKQLNELNLASISFVTA